MKVLNLIVIGFVIIALSGFANAATVHDEEIDPVWAYIASPESDMQNKKTGHADYGPFAISDDYVIRTLSIHSGTYLDEKCVENFGLETHSISYIYSVCTKASVREDIVFFSDLLGNKEEDNSPGAKVTSVSLSGDYAAFGSGNNLIHFFELSDKKEWFIAGTYTTDGTPYTIYISESSVYLGDTNVYSINKKDLTLNWKYVIGSPVRHIYGTDKGIIAGADNGVYFIADNGVLIEKRHIGPVSSVDVDGNNIAVGAGGNVYLFDSDGNEKFNYPADYEFVSDVRISTSKDIVVAGAGDMVYLLDLNGRLKSEKPFEVDGFVDTVDIWGEYVGAGVLWENSYHYLFDETGTIDIRHGDESEKTEVEVKSVTDIGDYSVVIDTTTYKNNVTNDKFKFYKLGHARAKNLIEIARFDVSNIEEMVEREKVEFDITDAIFHLSEAEKNFAENNYPEAFRHARICEVEIIDKIEELIFDAEMSVNESWEIGMETAYAEASLVSARNSLLITEYADAVVYAKNAEQTISAEVQNSISDARDFFESIRHVQGFNETLDSEGVERELNAADESFKAGDYTSAVEHSDKAGALIDKGLEDFIEKMIISAEGKYNDAKSIYANFLQPEEMALAERDIKESRDLFEEGKETGDPNKFIKVVDLAYAAEEEAVQARLRALAGYLMIAVLLWAVLSAFVFMTLKPAWPTPHYPGMEHAFDREEVEKRHVAAVAKKGEEYEVEVRETSKTLLDRVIMVLKLDEKVYSEAHDDKSTLVQGVIIILAAGFLTAVGTILQSMAFGLEYSFLLIIIAPILWLILWPLSTFLVHISALLLGGKANYMGFLRAMAFTYTPGVFGVIPILGGLISLIGSLICTVLAIKSAHKLSLGMAIFTLVVILMVCILISFFLLGPIISIISKI